MPLKFKFSYRLYWTLASSLHRALITDLAAKKRPQAERASGLFGLLCLRRALCLVEQTGIEHGGQVAFS